MRFLISMSHRFNNGYITFNNVNDVHSKDVMIHVRKLRWSKTPEECKKGYTSSWFNLIKFMENEIKSFL